MIAQLKEIMGNLQDFKVYLFVKQGSSFTTVMHSPMKFAAISAATGHLQVRIIGFVGDRTLTREPTLLVALYMAVLPGLGSSANG